MNQRFLFIVSIVLWQQIGFGQVVSNSKLVDSLIQLSNSDEISNEQSLNMALKAQEIALSSGNDSILLEANRNLAKMYFYNNLIEKYIPQNYQNLELAKVLKDSFAVGVASANLASIYRLNQKNDSAFYFYSNAIKFLSSSPPSYLKATSYYGLADVQHVVKVYDGAEIDAVKALGVLDELEKSEAVLDKYWGVYNLLAIIAKDLEDYNQAITYYYQSLEYSSQMSDALINDVYTLNNIANVYRNQGDYAKAQEILENLQERRKDYEAFDPAFVGNVLNNIALTNLESGRYNYNEIEKNLKEARSIAYTFDDDNGKVMTALDLSRLYLENERRDSVVKYASEALKLAEDFSSNEAKQRALFLLAEVTPGEKGKNYLKQHIKLGDSLVAQERSIRNKIARIKFDTDKLQAKNEQISKERFYLFIISIALLLTGILIYIILSQRAKNKELRLNQLQQEANEEIYNLMLKQQDKVEEARAEEKMRVSKELHDGVLGRLFGIRLSLDSLNLTHSKEAIISRGGYIEQLKVVEEEIRKISHELNMDFVAGSRFEDILKDLVETQSKAYGLQSRFEASEEIDWDEVSNKVKINMYRIVQESYAKCI